MQDKQHVLAIDPLRVLIEANVGPKLRPEASRRFGTAIPFQVEAHDATACEVKAFAVRSSDRSSTFLRPDTPAAPAALLTDPQEQPLVDMQAAGHGEIDEEPVGLQVVGDVSAMVPGVFRPPNVGPGRVAPKLSEQPPPSGCEQQQ